MTRRQAREYAFTLALESGIQKDKPTDELIRDTAEGQEFVPNEYIVEAINKIRENSEIIDEKISKAAKGWKFDRISNVSLAIMRLSVCEMLYMKEIPFVVSINEAVELAKKYDDDKAPKFINGILNSIAENENLKPPSAKPQSGEQ